MSHTLRQSIERFNFQLVHPDLLPILPMLHPRRSRFTAIFKSCSVTQSLATGKSFGCSTLNVDRQIAVESPISTNLTFISNTTTSIEIERSGLSALEVIKLVVLSIWLWCLLGVNSCLNGIGTISTAKTP
jgi:hypothetical protein